LKREETIQPFVR